MPGTIVKCRCCDREFERSTKANVHCSYECAMEWNRMHGRMAMNRFSIFERDGFKCFYCGRTSIEDKVTLEIDHIIPCREGIRNASINVVTACRECNVQKGGTNMGRNMINRAIREIARRYAAKPLLPQDFGELLPGRRNMKRDYLALLAKREALEKRNNKTG